MDILLSLLNSTLGIIVSILVLLGIAGGVSYYIYIKKSKVSVKGNDNIVIGDGNKIDKSFNKN